jgi:hypothetical protein
VNKPLGRAGFLCISQLRDDAKLLHHAQVVVNYPPFGDLPVLKAEDVYARDGELLASGGMPNTSLTCLRWWV